MMMPLYLVLTIALLLVRRDRRGAGVMLLGFVVMLLPLVAWQLIEPDRYANILSAYRLYDGDTTSGGGLLQRLATVSGLVSRIDILWDTFNPGRLFFTGESSLQISTRGVGSFLTPVAVLVALGLIALFQKRATLTDTSRLVLAGLVTAPLPAVMMADVEIRRWLVIVPFVATIACVGVDHLLGRGNVARAAAAVLVALLPLQFAGFMRDYFGPYREGASSWFGGNIRAALETVIDDAVRQPPSAVYIATEIPWVEAYWRFYSLAHGIDLGGRVHYIQLSAGELPRAQPGAVIVTPAPDASLAARLAEAGWTTQRVIPDLDGRPSMTVATGAAP
jgi:hypothetical protein